MKETSPESSAENKSQTPPSVEQTEPTLHDIHDRIREKMHPAGWVSEPTKVPGNPFSGINGVILPPVRIKS